MAPAGHPGTRAARAGTRARACGGRACARGGYRFLVCEVGGALAGQQGDEGGLSVGKGGRERVSWTKTGSGVFTSPLPDTKTPFIAMLPCEGTSDFTYENPIPPSSTGATPASTGPCARPCDASPRVTSRTHSLSIVLIGCRRLLVSLVHATHS